MDETKRIHRAEATQDSVAEKARYTDEVRGEIETFLKTPSVRTYMEMFRSLEAFTDEYRVLLELMEKFQLSPHINIEVLQWQPDYIQFSTIQMSLRRSGVRTIEETADLVSKLYQGQEVEILSSNTHQENL
ncbi:hypothetical protein [Roseofilum sp. Belize Diploria]|uniref:hypothetical protein n=1 Tax=Roseofilum sp. Belize Diploria TaxID=2821501 RepID=UPI001B0DD8BD|nr:hypothetical protein [Roseofilum sp. Belize Diploria]MBP0008083.1 hypothetical protein [Roseofilum sp. Belize Diploria]